MGNLANALQELRAERKQPRGTTRPFASKSLTSIGFVSCEARPRGQFESVTPFAWTPFACLWQHGSRTKRQPLAALPRGDKVPREESARPAKHCHF
jgi:hypothetical protein